MKQVTTILFLRRRGDILLAMKKRGFGEGKWNGVGGKVEGSETVVAAAIRECQEEIGVTPISPQLVGRLTFYDKFDPAFCHDSHVFIATEWEGEPAETEEMRPQWFQENDIPYEHMWSDDHLWMPLLLKGKLFKDRKVTFDHAALVQHDIKEVSSLDAT